MEGDQFMRRYQKWFSVGLLALTPGIALAGPFSGFGKKAPAPAPAAAAPQARKAPSPNDEMAQKVKASLEKARVSGPQIDIEYKSGGIVTLDGMVNTPDQKQAATKAAMAV